MSIEYTAPPQSRNEAILADTINDIEYTDPPQSRIEDLLIDLNGKIIGKQDALTEEQLAAVNSGINEEKVAKYDDIYAVMNYNAANHNGIYRGKDLTNIYTVEEIYERVHNGTFEDLYLGDYFTVNITTDLYSTFTGTAFESGVTYYERSGADLNNWIYTPTTDTTYDSNKTYYTMQTITEDVDLMIAAFDYYFRKGWWDLETHHIVLIPRKYKLDTKSAINLIDTTDGGYFNSHMHQTTLPCYAKSFKVALNGHLLLHRTRLTTATDADMLSMAGGGTVGASSGSTWERTELQLMNEIQVTGTMIYSSSYLEAGVDYKIFPLFNFVSTVIDIQNTTFWTRTIVSKEKYLAINNLGMLSTGAPSLDFGVCPIIVFG